MKEKIIALVQAIIKQENAEDAAYDVNFVQQRFDLFLNYSRGVFQDVLTYACNKELRDGSVIEQHDFEFRVCNADKSRRSAHNAVIDACKQLNRLCEKYGVDYICPVTDNRTEIASFVGQVVNELYCSGVGVSSVENMKQH